MKSTKSFHPSDTVSTFHPFVHLLSRKNRGILCDGCLRENKLTLCTGCSVFQYCSKLCQQDDHHYHRNECSIIKEQPSRLDEISDDAMFLLRLYHFSQSEEGKNKSETILENARGFSDLMSNNDNIVKDEGRCGHFMKLSVQIKRFTEESSSSLPNAKELLQTYGKMVTNSFSILDDNLNAIGSGLYLGASALDHSCDPNCIATFSGTQLLLRSNRHIKEGDELTISYVEQMNTTRRRQEELLEGYYFQCECNHCVDADRDMKMIGLKEEYEEYQDVIHLECKEMEKKAQTLKDQGKAQETYELSKAFFTKWSAKLNPQSVYVYKCLDIYFDACIDLNMWDKASTIGSKMIKNHSSHIPHPHPKRALDTIKHAKILLFLQKYEKALDHLEKAEEETKALFAKRSSLVEAVADLKYQCLMERGS